MAGASVESCQYVVLRSPWGRLGSVLDVCNRLRRIRGRFHRWVHIGTGPLVYFGEPQTSWVASEMFLAGHTRAMSLPAAKIIGEYQAALEAALQSPVPISALFKDTWHLCVPLVPALWVHLLPLMPRSLN